MEKRKGQVIFDLGNGGRVLVVLCSVMTTGTVIALVLNNTKELLELPSYSFRHPLEGLVYMIGAAFFVLIGIWGIWLLFGTLVFPREVSGRFLGWQVVQRRSGQRRQAQIILADKQLSTPCSLPLQHALETLPEQTEVKVTIGAFGFVTRIAR